MIMKGWGVAMMHWGHYGWGMGFGWLYMIIFWIAMIVAIFYFARTAFKTSDCMMQHESPLDILKRRYAKGELTREEFERAKEDLR